MIDRPVGDDPLTHGAVLRIVLVYAGTAALWILLSDSAVERLLPDPAHRTVVGMLKGWLFVAVTSLLLWGLMKRLVTRTQRFHAQHLESLQILDSIAESSDDAIFAKDLDGRYLLFNQAASRFVGRPVEQVLGRDDHAFFPAEQADMLMAIGRRILGSGRTETVEEVLDTPAGRRVFLATKGPLRDTQGRVFGLYGISRDITERQHTLTALRHREHQLAAIIGYSPSALSLKHPDGRYAVANPNVQRLHHRTEAEILGKTDFDLYPPESAEAYRANDLLVMASRVRHSVEELVPVDGVMRRYMSHIFPVVAQDGTVEYVARISLDITDSRRAEDALKARNEELERFNRAMVGREIDMIALKQQVHALEQALAQALAIPRAAPP